MVTRGAEALHGGPLGRIPVEKVQHNLAEHSELLLEPRFHGGTLPGQFLPPFPLNAIHYLHKCTWPDVCVVFWFQLIGPRGIIV